MGKDGYRVYISGSGTAKAKAAIRETAYWVPTQKRRRDKIPHNPPQREFLEGLQKGVYNNR